MTRPFQQPAVQISYFFSFSLESEDKIVSQNEVKIGITGEGSGGKAQRSPYPLIFQDQCSVSRVAPACQE